MQVKTSRSGNFDAGYAHVLAILILSYYFGEAVNRYIDAQSKRLTESQIQDIRKIVREEVALLSQEKSK